MRKGEISILAEDTQQRSFVRRVMKKLGFNSSQIYEVAPPANATKGRTFVLNRFSVELVEHRQRFHRARSRRLVVMIDADDESIEDVRRRLASQARDKGIEPPASQEGVVLLVPKREIENWLDYLDGKPIKEDEQCSKRKGSEGDIAHATSRFADFVRQPHSIPADALPSLTTAVDELRTELLADLTS